MFLENQHNIQSRQTLAFTIFQDRKMTFPKFSKMQIFFVNSVISNVFAVSLSTDIIARIVNLSSVIVDL